MLYQYKADHFYIQDINQLVNLHVFNFILKLIYFRTSSNSSFSKYIFPFSLSPKKKRKFSSYIESSDEDEPSTGYSYGIEGMIQYQCLNFIQFTFLNN